MERNNDINSFTLKLAQLGVLTAIIFILMFTPLGFLKIGVVSITFLMIPVAIGAIITGPKGGMFLGAMFGLASFLTCFGYDAFGVFLFGINPLFTAIITIIPRTMMGWLVGIIYKYLSKIDKTKTLSFAISAMSGAVINTILFVLFFVVLFGNNTDVLATFAATNVWGIIVALITANAILEAVVSLVVGGGIAKALYVYLPKPKEKNTQINKNTDEQPSSTVSETVVCAECGSDKVKKDGDVYICEYCNKKFSK